MKGQNWTTDPFTLRVEDGRAFGRGAVDMKAFAAIALALVPEFLAADLKTPIHIMLSYDEETTCLGVIDAINRLGVDLPLPKAAVCGEPAELEVVDAHKSVVTFTTEVHGFEAHSSKPYLGASAVMTAAELIGELNRIGDEMMERGDPSGRFDPPCTTVHLGSISGGNARNIISKHCAFQWEFRGLPSLDPKEIPARLERFANEVALKRLDPFGTWGRIQTTLAVAVPGLAPEPGSAAENMVLRLAGRNRTQTVPFGTEAGNYQKAGIPTVICGRLIDPAHQPDEYISLEQIDAGTAFMRRLAALCAAASDHVLFGLDRAVPSTPSRVEIVKTRAELARDADASVIAHHVASILRREPPHHRHHAGLRTTAFLVNALTIERAHAVFVEQPIKQTLARHRRIDKLMIFDGVNQRLRFRPRVVVAQFADRVRRGRLPGCLPATNQPGASVREMWAGTEPSPPPAR